MRKVESELSESHGITVGGRSVWNLRYADDTALLAKSKDELEIMGEALIRHSEEFGLKINSEKTFAMVWSNNNPVGSSWVEKRYRKLNVLNTWDR